MSTRCLLYLHALTDPGLRRTNNEDAWWAGALGGPLHAATAGTAGPLDCAVNPVLLLVSDGIGGSKGGEVASAMATELVAAGLAERRTRLTDAGQVPAAIIEAIKAANDRIAERAREPELEGMGATLSLACVFGDGRLVWAQVGDSRIYLCRQGRLRQLSHDHSPIGRLRQRGEITEAEARQHPLRNRIDRSLGDSAESSQPDLGNEALQAGDVLLICSDGLSDGLWDREIEEILAGVASGAEVRPVVETLVERAKQASGRDNITAVVAYVESTPGAGGSFWQRLRPNFQ
jgi:serine/threonine protein phosphatase PrpC